MTFLMSGASRLGNRFSKSLPNVALAATTLVGGATVLSGGQAQAFNCTFGPGGTCDTNVWHDSNPVATDKQILFKVLPTAGAGDIEFKWADINGNGTWNQPADWKVDQWHVDVDFNPDLMSADGTSTFEYIMKITDPAAWFWDVSLGSTIAPSPPVGGTVTKQLFEVLTGNIKGAPINGAITNTGMLNLEALGHYQQVYVVDTATANVGGSIDNYQNSFRQNVPGPLPLMGAGAAFGFTRKLRRRVKAFRMA